MSEIEENTKEQSNSKVWKVEREKRLTSSNFCYIFIGKASFRLALIVRSILHSDFKGTIWTQYGVKNELAEVKETFELKSERNEKLKFEKNRPGYEQEMPILGRESRWQINRQEWRIWTQ